MLYLNGFGEDFSGGTTNFINDNQPLLKDETGIFRAAEENINLRLEPRPGMALVFFHRVKNTHNLGNTSVFMIKIC